MDELEQLEIDWSLAKVFDLPPHSNIVVAGAYQGLAMEYLAKRFPDYDRIIGFEPQHWAADKARARLTAYRNAMVAGYGLATENTELKMGEWHTDGASFINNGPGSRQQHVGEVREFNQAMADVGLEHIDLFVMNLEGFEYILLPYMEVLGWLKKIDRLAVQFHLFPPVFTERYMDDAIERLTGYYNLEVDERPTWTYFLC